jgi:hypothetical protein
MNRVKRSAGRTQGLASTRQAFPVALYASLLVALLFLLRPAALQPLQSAAAALQSLPLRALGLLAAQPSARTAAASERAFAFAALRVDAWRASRSAQAAARPDGVPADLLPRWVPVRERRGEAGAGPTELLLDLPRAALGTGVAAFVTVGEVLVGFLEPLPVLDADDPCRGAARVSLLQRRVRGGLPRRVPAFIDAEDGPLAVVVEPAASIDAWPLRCVLPADPYRAASLRSSDLPVRTSGLGDDPLGPLPPGLSIGALQVYGYAGADGRVLPIGLFVAPAIPAEAIHAVTVWTGERGAAAVVTPRPLDGGLLFAARGSRLPVATSVRARWFVTTRELGGAWLRPGAALVHGERLVGVLDTAGLGYGVVAPFGQPGRSWAITLVPEGGGPPVDVAARALRRTGRVELELAAPLDGGFERGQAFSGAGGRDLPTGLWIGPAALAEPRLLLVEPVADLPEQGLAVHLHRGSPPEEGR